MKKVDGYVEKNRHFSSMKQNKAMLFFGHSGMHTQPQTLYVNEYGTDVDMDVFVMGKHVGGGRQQRDDVKGIASVLIDMGGVGNPC